MNPINFSQVIIGGVYSWLKLIINKTDYNSWYVENIQNIKKKC